MSTERDVFYNMLNKDKEMSVWKAGGWGWQQ